MSISSPQIYALIPDPIEQVLVKFVQTKKGKLSLSFSVGPLGLEPRLFGTKNRRVASYTMGQLITYQTDFLIMLGANVTHYSIMSSAERKKNNSFHKIFG